MIDCDVHNTVPALPSLYPYLSEHWVEYCRQSAFGGPGDGAYPAHVPTSVGPIWRGARPAPGTSAAAVAEQLLDPLGTEIAILNCVYAVESIHNPDTAAAMSSAVNDWQTAEWLDADPRLRASIVVPSAQPEMAAREIERVAGDRRFVQVLLPVRSAMPYGNRHYHHIFEAAERHGLAVGLHFGGAPGNPPTGAGWPSYYLEEYAGMAQIFQTQILSMISEGLFDRFPDLRIACIEGGFTWVPSLLWRIDKEWRGLRRDVPWVREEPSHYVHRHMRFTTRPLDAPPDPAGLADVIDDIGAEGMLLFATDYPHWHFDRIEDAIPEALPERLRRGILRDNARDFYRL